MVTLVLTHKRTFIWVALLTMLVSCIPLGTLPNSSSSSYSTETNEKKLLFEDYNYESNVGIITLNGGPDYIFDLDDNLQISLEFDLLSSQFENLQAKWIRCNYEWEPSVLPEIQYFNGFNQFDSKSVDYSVNTRIPYSRYVFNVSKPAISGNYILVVFRRNNPKDLIFGRRVLFYSHQVKPSIKIRQSQKVSDRRTHQQLDIELDYSGMDAPRPDLNFKVLVLQNKDLNRALTLPQPTSIKAGSSKLGWDYFQGEISFPGWNQFRWLDLRTVNFKGVGIASIKAEKNSIEVRQQTESDHGKESYKQAIDDNNGRFTQENLDPGEVFLGSDYVNVLFTLESDVNLGDVYVMGRFNNWNKSNENRMRYNPEKGIYETKIQLKQGYFDYRYEVVSSRFAPHYFEGTHFQTENEFDVLVYYRAPGQLVDQLVGLTSTNTEYFF